jgi:hypothetical protein
MAGESDGDQYLNELKEFLGFLRKLWALLAGVSVLFPLSNVFVKVIPLAKWDQGGLVYLSPELVTAVSTLACLFVILRTFARRHELAADGTRRSFQRRATLSFATGLLAIVIYLVAHYAIANDFYYDVLGWESDDLQRVLGDIVLLVAYSAFFGLMTRAFMLVGMLEYFSERDGAA